MNEEHAVAIVAGEDEFFSGGVAAMLKRQIGYATVLRAKSLLDLDELLALKMRIDLLVLDLSLPSAQGAMTVRQIHSTWPEMPIAVMTDSRDDHEILRLLAAGAQGVIPKDPGNCPAMLDGLRTVSDSRIYVPDSVEVMDGNGNGNGNGHCEDTLTGLTERQRQVIGLLSRGYPNKVIARELGISPSTVKVHVHAAFRTLGVHNRMAAAAALWPQHSKMAPIN
jgi:DNA-binding NarL/FixJ family response regulator